MRKVNDGAKVITNTERLVDLVFERWSKDIARDRGVVDSCRFRKNDPKDRDSATTTNAYD
jgi:hypothetical protein